MEKINEIKSCPGNWTSQITFTSFRAGLRTGSDRKFPLYFPQTFNNSQNSKKTNNIQILPPIFAQLDAISNSSRSLGIRDISRLFFAN